MNPLTNMKNVVKFSEGDLSRGGKSSWHDQYKDSAWIFVGGLPYELTEGDVVCIFSQYGEIVNINLIRDKDTGKSKGYGFICFENQKSTILAVDNFNGIKILNRIIRVDHVANYKVPKQGKKTDEAVKKLQSEGCAPKAIPPPRVKTPTPPRDVRETLADAIETDIKLPQRLPIVPIKKEKVDNETAAKIKEDLTTNSEGDSSPRRKKSKKSYKKRKSSSSDEDSAGHSKERSKTKHKQKNEKYKHKSIHR